MGSKDEGRPRLFSWFTSYTFHKSLLNWANETKYSGNACQVASITITTDAGREKKENALLPPDEQYCCEFPNVALIKPGLKTVLKHLASCAYRCFAAVAPESMIIE